VHTTAAPSGSLRAAKRYDVGAGGVQPLKVVDRDQHRALGGEPVGDGDKCRCYGPRIGVTRAVSAAQQCGIHTFPLGPGKIRPYRVIHIADQIGQRGVGQNGFGGGGAAGEYAEATVTGPRHRVLPQCRLTDTRIAFNHQCTWLAYRRVEEVDEGLLFCLPADDSFRHGAS
jgi:hypothetical protein